MKRKQQLCTKEREKIVQRLERVLRESYEKIARALQRRTRLIMKLLRRLHALIEVLGQELARRRRDK